MTASERLAGSLAANSGRRSSDLALIVLVAANIVLGLWLAPTSASRYETVNIRCGERSVRSYLDPLHPLPGPYAMTKDRST
jgi:hypothetical protein